MSASACQFTHFLGCGTRTRSPVLCYRRTVGPIGQIRYKQSYPTAAANEPEGRSDIAKILPGSALSVGRVRTGELTTAAAPSQSKAETADSHGPNAGFRAENGVVPPAHCKSPSHEHFSLDLYLPVV